MTVNYCIIYKNGSILEGNQLLSKTYDEHTDIK